METTKMGVAKVLHGEYKQADNFGKILLVGMLFNIPVPIPFLSQIGTLIVLSIFLKRYLLLLRSDAPIEKQLNLLFPYASKVFVVFTVALMFYQMPFFWLPFITQLVTLFFLGILYAVFSKYK
jgi:hypothetical protein